MVQHGKLEETLKRYMNSAAGAHHLDDVANHSEDDSKSYRYE